MSTLHKSTAGALLLIFLILISMAGCAKSRRATSGISEYKKSEPAISALDACLDKAASSRVSGTLMCFGYTEPCYQSVAERFERAERHCYEMDKLRRELPR